MGGVGEDLNRKGDKNTPEKWDWTVTGAPHLVKKDKRGVKKILDTFLICRMTIKNPHLQGRTRLK